MSLEPPKLDDRSFDDLVEEAKRRIAAKCEDWTDFNPSDPGMVLVDLMAWMTETVLYRLNRVPELNYVKYLELIGLRRQPARPARAWVFFEVEKKSEETALSTIAQGARVSTQPQGGHEPITFVTVKPLPLTASEIIKTCSFYGEPVKEQEEVHNLTGENAWATQIFGPAAGESSQSRLVQHNLYFGDPALGAYGTQAAAEIEIEVRKPMEGQLRLEWQAWNGDSWRQVDPVADATRNLEKSGAIRFEGLQLKELDFRKLKQQQLGSAETQPTSQERAMFWLRAVLRGSAVTQLPVLAKVQRRLSLKAPALRPQKALTQVVPPVISSRPTAVPPARPDTYIVVTASIPASAPQVVDTSTDFHPFGTKAQPQAAFYISSPLFALHGAEITIRFEWRKTLQPKADSPLEIHWEYMSTNSTWQPLGRSTSQDAGAAGEQAFHDETASFTRNGEIRFRCPPDSAPMEIGGQIGWFIRARIERAEFESDSAAQLVGVSVLLGFTDILRPWAICASEDYSEFKLHPTEAELDPFYIREPSTPAFYICFDAPPARNRGPYPLFFDVVEAPGSLEAILTWEYSAGSHKWEPLKVLHDGTEGLTRRGAVEFVSPEGWRLAEHLSPKGYWLRVRREEGGKAPQLQRILLNGVEVEQAIEQTQIPGSSDGSPHQRFSLNTGVLEGPEILIRETASPSSPTPAEGDHERDETSFRRRDGWVPWEEKKNFYHSRIVNDAPVRHFVVDLETGTFAFGDGKYGSIPPAGSQNVGVRYRVTQGKRGNVGANSIIILERPANHVKGIRNWHPAEGGSDREDLERVKRRGPWEVKHGNRAVTKEDFEALAQKSSPLVGKAHCFEAGGIVHVIVVPDSEEPAPMPGRILLEEVTEYLDERRLINTRLVVEGPVYEFLDVQVDVVVKSGFSGDFNAIQSRIKEELNRFISPLHGQDDGRGWDLGRALHKSELYYLIEKKIPAIKFVDNLTVCKAGTSQPEDRIEIGPRSFPSFSEKGMVINQAFE